MIAVALAEDGSSKSAEGVISIHLPDYFQTKDNQEVFQIEIQCYVVGPSRRYSYVGKTLDEAIDAAFKGLEDIEYEESLKPLEEG